ncbi:hypothetical protein VCRA2110O2_30187 [Vibrio crassostreae]|nr:hypothetical protein VCHA44O286_50188 [Vibrio chagasii]CAK2858793.1 hypothetical protein VCRA2110O2_30187 [Vibrio crassostreae]
MKLNSKALTIAVGLAITLSSIVTPVYAERRYDSSFDKDISGLDKDKDLIRDDIQTYLNTRYSGYPILRGEMGRYSVALDQLMLAKTVTEMMNAAKILDATKYCAIGWGYSEEEFIQHSSNIYSMQVNTRKRILAAAKAERTIVSFQKGQSRTKQYISYCEKEKTAQN